MSNQSSRYMGKFDERDSEAVLISERIDISRSQYFLHVVGSLESFTSLASQFLGDDSLYWIIADINPQIYFPDVIPVGTQVRIPLV